MLIPSFGVQVPTLRTSSFFNLSRSTLKLVRFPSWNSKLPVKPCRFVWNKDVYNVSSVENAASETFFFGHPVGVKTVAKLDRTREQPNKLNLHQ